MALFHSRWGKVGSKPVDNFAQDLRDSGLHDIAQTLLSNA